MVNKSANARMERRLRKLAHARAVKAQNRMSHPVEREPKMVRWIPMELGLRDTLCGEVAWVPFKSIRDAVRRLSVALREYQPMTRRSLP